MALDEDALDFISGPHGQENLFVPKCSCCNEPIKEDILKIQNLLFHQKCLICYDCKIPLVNRCYFKYSKYYCFEDFYRRFGVQCAGCLEGIQPLQSVRRTQGLVYHVKCFFCCFCEREMITGECFYLLKNNKLLCCLDCTFIKNETGFLTRTNTNKRSRTMISAAQQEALKEAYQDSSKPSRLIREKLAYKIGLDMRVVQVWFQNRRAKEKRLQKERKKTTQMSFDRFCTSLKYQDTMYSDMFYWSHQEKDLKMLQYKCEFVNLPESLLK